MLEKIYGEWLISVDPLRISNADQILGVQLLCDCRGRPEFVDFQYQTADQDLSIQEVRMDWSNALALLSYLKSLQLDSGQPFPLDPRDRN
ncbi:hypothetical protein [Sphingomonas sp. M1-B02]|uniref:hypothetical protein n=1 Tax=Sphingomonas sp. M1-B02 TaxID=3114300 RepID=UPI00223F97A1|nr:hypothetical protein [Sphingomonas sp. S6-11]UZK67818.1 hypothetical protein OKW87_08355 [Sphingomonas sp. S6-11]